MKQSLGYFSQLDGLRFFAIISVMVGHFIAWDSKTEWIKGFPWSHGVILFFVLSGYLITNILLQLKQDIFVGKLTLGKALKNFYVRRLLRIFPVYYLLVFYLNYIDFENTRDILPWLVTHTSNIYQSLTNEYIGSFNHFWSLAVEEQFYLFWPFVIILIPNKHLLKTLFVVITISALSRFLSAYLLNDHWMFSAYFTTTQFVPLCIGALLAFHKHHPIKYFKHINNVFILYSLIFVYAIIYFLFSYRQHTFWFSMYIDEYLYAFVCLFLVNRASKNGFTLIGKKILEHDITVFTGKISYGMYLYHLFVPSLLWNYLKFSVENKNIMWLVYFMITYVLAILSYYLIEKGFNNFKKHFPY